jgi:hypothetical protein
MLISVKERESEMIASTLLLLSVAALLGQMTWTRARSRASLQPVRVRVSATRRPR